MTNISLSEISRKPTLNIREAALVVSRSIETIRDWRRGYYQNKIRRTFYPDGRKLEGLFQKNDNGRREWFVWRNDLIDYANGVAEFQRRNRTMQKWEPGSRPKFGTVR